MAATNPANVAINPDDFPETNDGRVWTPVRNASAWEHSYKALERAIKDAEGTPRVVLVCGIQGAGKTTWIASQPASPTTIYFDAALPGVRHRALIVGITRRLGVPIDAVWIRVPLEAAIARNARRPSDKVVPVAVIRSVANQFEEPTTAEGFDHILIVDPGAISA